MCIDGAVQIIIKVTHTQNTDGSVRECFSAGKMDISNNTQNFKSSKLWDLSRIFFWGGGSLHNATTVHRTGSKEEVLSSFVH